MGLLDKLFNNPTPYEDVKSVYNNDGSFVLEKRTEKGVVRYISNSPYTSRTNTGHKILQQNRIAPELKIESIDKTISIINDKENSVTSVTIDKKYKDKIKIVKSFYGINTNTDIPKREKYTLFYENLELYKTECKKLNVEYHKKKSSKK